MAKKLILASSSPRRKELLAQIGITPDAIVPANIDESVKTIRGKMELPGGYCKRIAIEKAMAVASSYPDDIILAGDTIIAVGRRILLKPANQDEAEQQIKLLSGRQHRVYSSVSVVYKVKSQAQEQSAENDSAENEDYNYKQKIAHKQSCSFVSFKKLENWEIENFIATGEWQDKSGSYALQGMASGFIRKINGSPSAIIGLPLYETRNMLLSAGYRL